MRDDVAAVEACGRACMREYVVAIGGIDVRGCGSGGGGLAAGLGTCSK